MAWGDIPKLVVGQMIDASWMNTYVRDNLIALSTHGHTGAAGDGSASLSSGDYFELDQGGALSDPAGGHTRFAANTDGTLRFRADGASEKTISDTGHAH